VRAGGSPIVGGSAVSIISLAGVYECVAHFHLEAPLSN
jgi:hypothetical protein